MEKEQKNSTRRSALKAMGKSTVFVAPVIASFKLSELTAKASGIRVMKDEPGNAFRK